MPGEYTNGVPQLTSQTGSELFICDTQLANGANPQSASISLAQLAIAVKLYGTSLDKTMVAGTRYFSSVQIGNPQTITGISALVGSTGGTDLWDFELHGPTGLLLATSLATGTTAGTANTFQQLAFVTPYTVTVPGLYWIAVQSNGNTAKLGTINIPTSPIFTGSGTGTLGTAASITPTTTYTANLGPVAALY